MRYRITLAPGSYQFRSCAWAFMELGRFDRAHDFIRFDAGSDWANYVTPSLLLREGRVAEAREAVKRMPNAPITAVIWWKPASGSGPRRNWTAWHTKQKLAALQTPTLRTPIIKGRFSPTQARRKRHFTSLRLRSTRTTARTPTYFPIRY